jgi:hypothetical protein
LRCCRALVVVEVERDRPIGDRLRAYEFDEAVEHRTLVRRVATSAKENDHRAIILDGVAPEQHSSG